MERDLEKLLAGQGLRVTLPRKAVFRVLQSADRPLSHAEIASALTTIDKTSVYRTIELFLKWGVVIGVAHGWKQRYELADPFRPHHHHLHCVKCDSITQIQSGKLEELINEIADANQFRVTGHVFEVAGVCQDCRNSAT